MIKLKNRVHTIFKNTKSLKHDLKKLKHVLFDSFGVIGIQITGNPSKLAGILSNEEVQHVFYHVEEDMYLILCKDISEEEFENFYHDVKVDLQQRYHSVVSIYRLYSDDDPQPEVLIKMVVKLIQVNQDALKINEECRSVLNQLQTGRYVMFLQQKADSKTRTITGAEALVRYQNENGCIFPPGRFIPQLEQKGCDNIQGFLIGRSISIHAYEKMYLLKKDKVMVNCTEKKQAVL